MAEGLEFYKMSGAGNDFILGDNRQGNWSAYPLDSLAKGLCLQHLSVGADGMILVEHSKKAHLKLQIFNADGSRSPMCGNGVRCAARYALLKVIGGRQMTIEVGPDVLNAEILPGDLVRIDVPGQAEPPQRVDILVNGRPLPAFTTQTGVPHAVIFVKDRQALEDLPVSRLGAIVRRAPEFGPAGTNVDFVALSPAPPFSIRTYERGVEGETLACGTGVTAAAWVLSHLGRSGDDVRLLTRSGRELLVQLLNRPSPAPQFTLTGEARLVFRATLPLEAIQEALRCG
jgi:diaminopimelate epimerase